jgi:hypothetical protein
MVLAGSRDAYQHIDGVEGDEKSVERIKALN